jgi:hypothetical protein
MYHKQNGKTNIVQATPNSGSGSTIDSTHDTSSQQALMLPTTCAFTRTSLRITEATTEAEWKAIGVTLATMRGAVQFWIGDWLRFGENKNYVGSDKYDQAEELTGFKRGTLKVYASVAKNISPLMRINELPFQHHQLVASLAPKEQEGWLEKAVDEKMTVKALRAAISNGSEAEPEPRGQVLAAVKTKLQRIVAAHVDWPELADVRKAIDAL